MTKFGIRTLFVVVTIFGLLFWIFVQFVEPARNKNRITSCQNHLRQIALAMMNYESGHGNLPLGIEIGPDKEKWHSWRTRILPAYMEAAPLIYDSTQPWNSTANMRLLNGTPVLVTDKGGLNPHMTTPGPFPIAFSCPAGHHDNTPEERMNYSVVIGDPTAFPLNGRISLSDITDGLENTILVVETISLGAQWTEPKDLEFDTMSFKINDRKLAGISSHHPGGACVVFADGATFFVTEQITPDELRALLTIAGNEPVTRKDLIERGILK